MRLTKDEARILSAAMEIAKYDFPYESRVVFKKLEDLEKRLEDFGDDKRRHGRKSLNDFDDLLKRWANVSTLLKW